jgi:hypothetical protein
MWEESEQIVVWFNIFDCYAKQRERKFSEQELTFYVNKFHPLNANILG